jgi:predicted deacetylase
MNETFDFDFNTLNIEIPNLVNSYPIEKQREIFEYLHNLNEHDKKAYLVAFQHLGSSFNIYRSNGFKEWKQSKK